VVRARRQPAHPLLEIRGNDHGVELCFALALGPAAGGVEAEQRRRSIGGQEGGREGGRQERERQRERKKGRLRPAG